MPPPLRKAAAAAGTGVAAALLLRQSIRKSRWFSYAGKSVVVTGGFSGLGLVLARQLADAGARLAIAARTGEDLRAAEAALRRRGAEVLSFPCDVRDEDHVRSLIDRVVERCGGVDILFNVAGVRGGPPR